MQQTMVGSVNAWAKKLLYMCMKKALPQSCKGKEEKLYIVPPQIKILLPNSTSFVHASHYTSTDESHALNIHLDVFHNELEMKEKASLPMIEIQ
eukprot:3744331-Ditylum_brightwellii.AAC.1